jgi:hypothetical protein
MTLTESFVKRTMDSAISESILVRIRYEKEGRNEPAINRTIEPYEIKTEELLGGEKRTYLYGYDVTNGLPPNKQHMKRWLTSNFQIVTPLKEQFFTPRSFK